MPIVEVIAKKDLLPFFSKGQKAKIVPVLYEEDTLLVNEIYGAFEGDKFIRMLAQPSDILKEKAGDKIKKIFEPVYALKGSYKDSYIELEDGRQYPSSIVRDYNDYFEKIN
jgi:hypothetical protein